MPLHGLTRTLSTCEFEGQRGADTDVGPRSVHSVILYNTFIYILYIWVCTLVILVTLTSEIW